jgi:hypothetical protein
MARISPITRNLAIASLLVPLLSLTSSASPMNSQQVRAMTEGWISRSGELRGSQVEQMRPLAWEADEPLFYLAELADGWVLASADDALRPVLGWSDQSWTGAELPPALVDWLMSAEAEALQLRAKDSESPAARADWQELLGAGDPADSPLLTDPSDVAPLLSGLWSQGVTFNESCPADAAGPGGHVYVGCVAVAMAQVMDFWNWPQQGAGAQSYVHSVYGPISVDFSQASYDWSAIDPAAGNAAVQQLLYHAGVSVRMNYGPSISTAQSSMIVNALRSYFHYQSTTRMVWRSSYTAQAWRDLLHTELTAGRPVIYRGQGSSGGHAFDVDGVQDSTWFHINWGWAGNYNGWFELTDLSPGNYAFNDVQGAVIGIAPDGVAINHQPVVPILYLEGAQDVPVTTTLVGYDVDGDALTYRVDGVPLAGNVWTWTPPQGASGTFMFSYQACDASSCSAPASITVVIAGGNHLPTVANLSLQALPNQTVSATLLGSDSDGDALSYRVDGVPVFSDQWTWTPPQGASGSFTFYYQACDAVGCGAAGTITVVVARGNRLPIVADVVVETIENQRVEVILSASDADGDSLAFQVNGQMLAGSVWDWDPPSDTHGVFTFSYRASDGMDLSEPANLTVMVNHVNHLPTVVDRLVEARAGQPLSVTLAGSDADGDSLSFLVEGAALAGEVFTWTPEHDARGLYTFSYQACDTAGCGAAATLTVVVTATNGAPVAAPMLVEGLEDESLTIALAGYDADGDELSYLVNGEALAGDQFTWTPAPNASGDFTFEYQACDSAACSEIAILTVRILPVNDAPVAQPVFQHLLTPGEQHIQLVAWDVDSDSLSYVVDGQPQDSSIFTVTVDENSPLSFSYFVTDGEAVSDTVAVELTFAPKDGTAKVQEDGPGTGATPRVEGLAQTSPVATGLAPAYPNPFNPATSIVFQLAESAPVRLAIYNVLGQQVAVLVDGLAEAGRHELRWEASGVASGAYLAVLQTPAGLHSQILQLVR